MGNNIVYLTNEEYNAIMEAREELALESIQKDVKHVLNKGDKIIGHNLHKVNKVIDKNIKKVVGKEASHSIHKIEKGINHNIKKAGKIVKKYI